MTYQDPKNRDPNVYPNTEANRNRRLQANTNYTPWLIGAVILAAVVIGIFAMSNRGSDNTALNNGTPAATTTGSGTTGAAPSDAARPNPAPAVPAR